MSENIQQKIEQLRKELHQHNENYYLLDTPTISDYEFDMLLEELRIWKQNILNFMMKTLLPCV
jgi:DNA ligase (NAD+)